jgi:uncharacterized protein YjbI with pentapeptide repeats
MALAININRRSAIAIIGALIGLFSLSLVAITSAHGGNNSPNLIHACVLNTLGTVRIVGTTTACALGETAVHWNTQGSFGGFVNDLTGADFTEADLRYRSFAGYDLSDAIFSSANLAHVDFANANLTNAQFNGTTLRTSTGWSSVTLSGTDLSNADMGPIDFSTKDLRTVTLTGAALDDSNLSGADLDHNDLTNTNMFRGNFTGADFSDTELEDAVMDQGNFTNTNLDGATNLTYADAATWNNTTCPDGTNSNSNGNTCIGHLNP